jgi:hypothetical protein
MRTKQKLFKLADKNVDFNGEYYYIKLNRTNVKVMFIKLKKPPPMAVVMY